MELRQLRYFVAIAELENFRKAGDRLRIAQPALSHQISLLENEIGVKLFERLPRGVRLSDAGRSLLSDARAILAKLEHAGERARSVGRGQAGPLRIGFSEANCVQGVIVESIQTFRALEPGVKMVLSLLPSRSLRVALANHQLDACFLYQTPEARSEVLHLQLRMDRVHAAIPSSHRLAAARDVRIADLNGEPIIWISPTGSPRLHAGLRQAFSQAGFKPHVVHEADRGAQMLTLVALGLGVGLACYSDWRLTPPGVVLRPVRDLELSFPFDLAWHADHQLPALTSFVQVVHDVAERYQAGTRLAASVKRGGAKATAAKRKRAKA